MFEIDNKPNYDIAKRLEDLGRIRAILENIFENELPTILGNDRNDFIDNVKDSRYLELFYQSMNTLKDRLTEAVLIARNHHDN